MTEEELRTLVQSHKKVMSACHYLLEGVAKGEPMNPGKVQKIILILAEAEALVVKVALS